MLVRCRQKGIAMMMAIAVISALVLIAIFLSFSTGIEKRVTNTFYLNTKAKLAAKAAFNYAVGMLSKTCYQNERYAAQLPIYKTPNYDDPKEYEVNFEIPDLNVDDPKGEMWSVQVEDEQGKININSATPWLLGNLIGSAIIKEKIGAYDKEIIVDSTYNFSKNGGYLWINGELIYYKNTRHDRFTGCKRGLYNNSPRFTKPQALNPGDLIIDARAHRICTHRILRNKNQFTPYKTVEDIKSIANQGMYSIDNKLFLKLKPLLTVHSQRNNLHGWIHEQKIQNNLPNGNLYTSDIVTIEDTAYYREGMTVRIKQDDKTAYAMILSVKNNNLVLDTKVKHVFYKNKATISVLKPHPVNLNSAHPKIIYAALKGLKVKNNWIDSKQAAILTSAIFGMRQIGGYIKSHEHFYKFLENLKDRLIKAKIKDSLGLPALTIDEIRAILSSAINTGGIQGRFQGMSIIHSSGNYYTPTPPLVPFIYKNYDTYTINATGIINHDTGIQLAQHSLKKIVTVSTLKTQHWDLESQYDFCSYMQTLPSYKVVTKPDLIQYFTTFPSSNPNAENSGLCIDTVQMYPRTPNDADSSVYYPWEDTHDGIECPGTQTPTLTFLSKDDKITPGALSFWFYPLSNSQNYTIFDMGKSEWENRLTLLYKNGQLILQISDSTMDKKTAQICANINFEKQWYHIIAGWHSNQPGGLSLWIDGNPAGEFSYNYNNRKQQSVLLENLGTTSNKIRVSSTLGFEPEGVIQIGDEAIEYSQIVANTLIVRKKYDGFEEYELKRGARHSIALKHPSGAFVSNFGYTDYLTTNLFPATKLIHNLQEAGKTYSTLTRNLAKTSNQIYANTSGFPPKGYLLITYLTKNNNIVKEIVKYESTTSAMFSKCQRGQFDTNNEEFSETPTYIFPLSIAVESNREYPQYDGIIQIDDEWISYELTKDNDIFVYSKSINDSTIIDWLENVKNGKNYKPKYRNIAKTLTSYHRYGKKVMPVVNNRFGWGGRFDKVTIISGSKQDQKETNIINWKYKNHIAFTNDVKNKYKDKGRTQILKFPTGELPASGSKYSWGRDITKTASSPFLIDELQFIQQKEKDSYWIDKYILKHNNKLQLNSTVGWNLTDSGICKIGDEYIGYSSISGDSIIASNRGFGNTIQQNYSAGTPIYRIFYLPVSRLTKSIITYSPKITLKNNSDFPQEGYIKCDDEIIGYSSKTSSELLMPTDNRDRGLLRGTFGTKITNHDKDSLVYSFPTRYWDRYLKGNDSTKAAFFEASKSAPNALWKRIYWKEENPNPNYLNVLVKARIDGKPDWNTVPTNEKGGLFQFTNPNDLNYINQAGDTLEIRIYFIYKDGAYKNNYWKKNILLKSLTVEYLQPTYIWETETDY